MDPARLLEICRERGIDRVAITDHNAFQGALEAAERDPERVILGEEIKTTQGELLGYYMQDFVPPGLTPQETIARLRDQGAVISVAHPCDPLRAGSWSKEDLTAILPLIDAVEIRNARTMSSRANRLAAALAAEAMLPGTAGSDAHAYLEIGRVQMRLPAFNDAQSFLKALHSAECFGRRSPLWVHLLSRYAAWRKK
jgi:predicted metal-dependent phosphoesterase TrpH